VRRSSQEALMLSRLVVCLPGVETGDIVQSVDKWFFYGRTVKVAYYHGVIYCIMFPWAVRSFSRSTQGAIHLSEESCTFVM
jgi:hypothetical protein